MLATNEPQNLPPGTIFGANEAPQGGGIQIRPISGQDISENIMKVKKRNRLEIQTKVATGSTAVASADAPPATPSLNRRPVVARPLNKDSEVDPEIKNVP